MQVKTENNIMSLGDALKKLQANIQKRCNFDFVDTPNSDVKAEKDDRKEENKATPKYTEARILESRVIHNSTPKAMEAIPQYKPISAPKAEPEMKKDTPKYTEAKSEVIHNSIPLASKDKPQYKPGEGTILYRFHDFSSLSIGQRNMLNAIFNNVKMKGGLSTGKLNIHYISERSGVPVKTVKSTILKLQKKGLLKTENYRTGRGGWVIYTLPQEVFCELIKEEKLYQQSEKVIPQDMPQYTENGLYSSSIYINNNNITTTQQKDLPSEWEQIDISVLADIGLSKKHLVDLYEAKKLSASSVENSIQRFAWGMKNNPDAYKDYRNPLSPLIGVLKKGGEWLEVKYKSEADELMAKMLEISKQKAKDREKTIDDFVEADFEGWQDGLTEEKLEEIAPSNYFQGKFREQTLKEHFRKHVLIPRLREKGILKSDY